VTLYNENYQQPPMPDGVREGIVSGLYRFRQATGDHGRRARLLGSGPILREVLRAADLLAERYDVAADVWSATSFQQLRAEALASERWNRLHPTGEARTPYVTAELERGKGPVVAATDYLKAVPDMVARWVPGDYTTLGTDGYGLSDTREALRRHFEIDAEHIVVATLSALARAGNGSAEEVAAAIRDLGIDPDAPDPCSKRSTSTRRSPPSTSSGARASRPRSTSSRSSWSRSRASSCGTITTTRTSCSWWSRASW